MSDKKLLSKEYLFAVFTKLVDNLLSVKVWVIIGVLALTAKMVYDQQLSGGEFVTINTSLTSIAIGMREVFKVNRVRALSLNNETEKISNMRD